LGRRIEKIADGSRTRYVYTRKDIICEYDGAMNLLASYVYGPEVDEPLGMRRNSSNYSYHEDGLGSVIGITDQNEIVGASYTYDSFGQVVEKIGDLLNPYAYTARELDIETGLYYYRARTYFPEIGRFLQVDLLLSTNLYLYVENNPINLTDPTGEAPNVDSSCNCGSFNKQATDTAINSVRNKLTSTKCVQSESLRKDLIKTLDNITVKCDEKLESCGAARRRPAFWDKSITIGKPGMDPLLCGPLWHDP